MEEKLRLAATALRKDLTADHFEGKRRLSDPNFWLVGPPREGFFRIWQGSVLGSPNAQYALEGVDSDGNPSFRAVDHTLHFTIKVRGNTRDNFLTAYIDPTIDPVSPFFATLANGGPNPNFQNTNFVTANADARFQDTANTYNSQWAEVAYFLRPMPAGYSANGTQLYALYRRQLVVVPDNRGLNWPAAAAAGVVPVPTAKRPAYADVSHQIHPQRPGFLYFNNPADLTIPQRRFGMHREHPPGPLPNPRYPPFGVPPPPPAPAGIPPDMASGVSVIPPLSRNPPTDPRTLTYPRLGEDYAVPNGLINSDLLLSDVVSFQVRILQPGGADFVDIPAGNNLFGSTAFNPNGPRFFDTWTKANDESYDYFGNPNNNWTSTLTSKSLPQTYRVMAVQITLRVWDVKTEQTRQITIIQDL
jgi:hypothetical protein